MQQFIQCLSPASERNNATPSRHCDKNPQLPSITPSPSRHLRPQNVLLSLLPPPRRRPAPLDRLSRPCERGNTPPQWPHNHFPLAPIRDNIPPNPSKSRSGTPPPHPHIHNLHRSQWRSFILPSHRLRLLCHLSPIGSSGLPFWESAHCHSYRSCASEIESSLCEITGEEYQEDRGFSYRWWNIVGVVGLLEPGGSWDCELSVSMCFERCHCCGSSGVFEFVSLTSPCSSGL